MDWGLITKLVMYAIGGYVVLLTWLGKDYADRIKKNSKGVEKNKEDISSLKSNHMVYDEKLNNIKEDLTEIKLDIKQLLTDHKRN